MVAYTIFLFGSAKTLGQSGNLQGVIIDTDGIHIPGATLSIHELDRVAFSDFDGKFTLLNLPEGNHTLVVAYLGYTNIEKEVTIYDKETSQIEIVLQSESIRLDDVTIIAYPNTSQVRALNTQKSNINITNVISTDQIGKFPDANIGDAIKRVSGITIQVDQGEARDMIVRGLSPQLNSVTINGSRIPSAKGDNRNIQLDLIPSDMIQTIEVSKALTPDMDADALGASVNLMTLTPTHGFRFSTTLGSGINFITEEKIWNGSFLIGDRTKEGNFGWMLSASIYNNNFGSHNLEGEWADSFSFNTGEVTEDEEPIIEEISVTPYTSVLEQQTHFIQRVRRSFAANLDYRLNNEHSFFLKSIYNWRDDRENRYVFENEVLAGEDIERSDFEIENNRLVSFPVEVSRQVRGGIDNDRNQNTRLEDQRMQNYTLGGEHLLGGVSIDWLGSFSKASEKSGKERIIEFKSEYTVINDNSNPELPFFRPINANDPNVLDDFLYEEITEENRYTEEEDFNFFLNVEIPLKIFDERDGNLKMGGRGRLKTKFRNNDFLVFDLSEQFPTLADVPTKDYSDPNFLVGSQYQAGFFTDEQWLGGLELEGGESVPEDFLGQNYEVSEDVWAGYAMSQQQLSDKLTLLAGVRLEYTSVSATGNDIEQGGILVGQLKEQQSYVNILPGIHFKYTLSDATLLRLAWTNTIARPNYVDLAPTREIVFEDREVAVGNPSLKTTNSMNFDIMGEHYFKSVGTISGGIFYKEIDDFIYTFRSRTIDDRFGKGTTGFTIFQPLNGDGAELFGVELVFQRQLDFLPGFGKNLSIDINYTHLASKAKGIRDINGVERNDLDLPDTSPHLFNISLGYKDRKISARISTNFSDGYVDEIGSTSFNDIYYDDQFFLDFNANYNIHKNWNIYVGLNNITNQPLRLYQGTKSRTSQIEFYERKLTFGIKYNLFQSKNSP